LDKRVLPAQPDLPRENINRVHWLHTAIGELRTHMVKSITDIEGLRLLAIDILDRLSNICYRTENMS
jgi:hypothetical protein